MDKKFHCDFDTKSHSKTHFFFKRYAKRNLVRGKKGSEIFTLGSPRRRRGAVAVSLLSLLSAASAAPILNFEDQLGVVLGYFWCFSWGASSGRPVFWPPRLLAAPSSGRRLSKNRSGKTWIKSFIVILIQSPIAKRTFFSNGTQNETLFEEKRGLRFLHSGPPAEGGGRSLSLSSLSSPPRQRRRF